MRIGVIGLGLIGGSLAIQLRKNKLASSIIGVENNKEHAEIAVSKGLVEEVLSLEKAIEQTDLLILAVSADVTIQLLPRILNLIENQIVIDVCSIKRSVCKVVATHPKRSNYVSTHPMAGTENSGPNAAVEGLFDHKAVVLVETEKSNPEVVQQVSELFKALSMRLVFMNAKEHDKQAAYISHISHVSSMALALTVLEKEKNEKNIFNLASGGFDSTVRLAKSSSQMWVPIFSNNSDNILVVLDEYISQLKNFKKSIEDTNKSQMEIWINNANRITKILDK